MTPLFPKLPKNLNDQEFKAELERRMAIMDQLGLTKPSRKSKNAVRR